MGLRRICVVALTLLILAMVTRAGVIATGRPASAAVVEQHKRTGRQISMPGQRTLVTIQGSIDAFAQDDGHIAWLQSNDGSDCPGQVIVRTLASGRQTSVGEGNQWGRVCLVTQTKAVPLALGGQRVVWGGFDSASNSGYGGLATSAPGERAGGDLQALVWEHWFWGDYLAGVSGDGSTLVYATVVVTHVPEDDNQCYQSSSCVFTVVGGGVKRVIGGRAVPLVGAPPAVLVAASDGMVAIVPADRRRGRGNRLFDGIPGSAPNGPVEIRKTATGAVLARFAPVGSVEAIALSASFAVVLVQQGAPKRIERYDVRTGKLLGSTTVRPGTAPTVSVAGTRIVYHIGRKIFLLDGVNRRTSLLGVSKGLPVGLSIEGGRVAWAETFNGTQARIQAIKLSG